MPRTPASTLRRWAPGLVAALAAFGLGAWSLYWWWNPPGTRWQLTLHAEGIGRLDYRVSADQPGRIVSLARARVARDVADASEGLESLGDRRLRLDRRELSWSLQIPERWGKPEGRLRLCNGVDFLQVATVLPTRQTGVQLDLLRLSFGGEELAVNWTSPWVALGDSAAWATRSTDSFRIFSLGSGREAVLDQVAQALETLQRSVPGARTSPRDLRNAVFLIVDEAYLGSVRPDGVLSNVLVGDYSTQSAALRWRVAGLWFDHQLRLDRPLPGDNFRRSVLMAAGDLLAQRYLGTDRQVDDAWAMRSASQFLLVAKSAEELADDSILEHLGSDPVIGAMALRRSWDSIFRDSVVTDGPGGSEAVRLPRLIELASDDWGELHLEHLDDLVAGVQAAAARDQRPQDSVAAEIDPSLQFDVAANFHGFLDDCGCKVVAGGGLIRLLAAWEAEEGSASALRVLAGNIFATRERGRGAEINAGIARALGQIPHALVIPGADELLATVDGIWQLEDCPVPVVCANLRDRSGGPPRGVVPWMDLALGGHRLRLVGLTDLIPGDRLRQEEERIRKRWQLLPLEAALQPALEDLGDIDLLVVAGVYREDLLAGVQWPAQVAVALVPTNDVALNIPTSASESPPRMRIGRDLGAYGIGRIRVDLERGTAGFEAIPLRSGKKVPASMSFLDEILAEAQGQEIELQYREELLRDGNEYVGSEQCRICHEEQHGQWRMTPHATAFNTLLAIEKHRNDNCVACHTVGFEEPSGFRDTGRPFALRGVGCEVCHGPGSKHLHDPADARWIRKTPSESQCQHCHSLKHSDFELGLADEYFGKVRH